MRSRNLGWVAWVVVACGAGCGSSANPPSTTAVCDNASLDAGCHVGHCTLSSAASPLPAGSKLTLTETSVGSDLAGDTISSTLCEVSLPANAAAGEIALSIAMDQSTPVADAVIFDWDSSLATAVATNVEPSSVSALLPGSGAFGVTHTPGAASFGGDIGAPALSSATLPDALRNLETSTFTAAFFDGQHLIVGDGPRVLIYAGMPHLGDLPAVVLGQPDFDSAAGSTTSASSFGGVGSGGIWSDGTRLVVSNSNRVLIWLSFPTANFAPADLVLGQTDFASNKANAGGNVGPTTLFGATEVDSDGTRLIVADEWNSRVLEWASFPTTVGQAPDAVIGQPNATSSTPTTGRPRSICPSAQR